MKILTLFSILTVILIDPLFGAQRYFSNLKYENGLPSNITNSIIQDNQGYIWIGTDQGICRYDGYSMVYFNKENTNNKIKSNRISGLLLDDDIIWIGTWDKLYTIHTKTFEIKEISTGGVNAFRTIYKDSNNNIWIGTNSGLIQYLKDIDKYRFFNNSNSNLSHNTVRAISEDNEGTIWVGTYDGINKFKDNKFINYDLKGGYKPQINNNLILDIKPSTLSDSILLVGTETGFCIFNSKSGKYSNYNTSNSKLSNEVIKSIHISDKELWLGTDYGLNIFNYETNQIQSFFHNPHINHTICNNVIWDIFQDSNQLLWFITSNGISLLDNTNKDYSLHEVILNSDGIKAGNRIRDILVLKDGSKWLATIHGVIHQTKNGNEIFTSKSKHRILLDNVYAVEEDNYGKIWIGTAGGINIWNPKTKEMHSISSNNINGLSSNYINQFCKSIDGKMWVSAWEGGVFEINGDISKLSNITFSKITDSGEALIGIAENTLYFTEQNQLFEYNPETKETKTVIAYSDSITNIDFTGLKCKPNGEIWLVNKFGLYLYSRQTKSIQKYYFDKPSAQILSIEIDQEGYIWVSTYKSITKYNKTGKQLLALPLHTKTPINSFISKSSNYGADNHIYFGGQNGYVKINSDLQYKQQKKPFVNICGLKINNEDILPESNHPIISRDIGYISNLELDHNKNSLLFYFTNHDYWLPELNSYAYKLNGYDNNWNYTEGDKNFGIYSNLKPGDYTLQVKGRSHNGIASENTASISFTITPPIWLSNGFIMMYIIIIIAIIYLVFHIYNYRNKLSNKLKITKLEKEHSEKLFEEKQEFFTNISHEFRTPLSLIIPPIKQVLNNGEIDNKSRHMLELANKNSNRLMMLINQILDFRKLETSGIKLQASLTNINSLAQRVFDSFGDLASRNEINYKLINNSNIETLKIDEQKVDTILYNLLSNAFKYTPINGDITLELTSSKDMLHLSVTDSGKGISMEDQSNIFERFFQSSNNPISVNGTGIGLTLSLKYAQLHKGTINIKSKPNKGSHFCVDIPIVDSQTEEIKTVVYETKTTLPPLDKDQILKTKTLLIIDDNPDILDFIELNLSDNYNILRASNGKEGLDTGIKQQPHLIISDVMMPQMDGNTLCKELKRHTKTMHIPVILLTAKSLEQQKLQGVQNGADMYITKPFNIEYLTACITNIMKHEEDLIRYAKRIISVNPEIETDENNNKDTQFVKRVMTQIENNITNTSFSVELLADDIGISTTHLYRKLKNLTGLSTQDIIKKYRLEKAAKMLSNKEGNITEVMYSVGFSSLSTFSKAFKIHFKIAPSEYQKRANDKL